MGKFISPQQGFWQNAEPVGKDFSANLNVPALNKSADVYFDDRLVPHVFVNNENDAYFIQGIFACKVSSLANEFQTHAAAGRLSEVLGAGPDSAYLNNDRNMRRVGMVFGAERSLAEMEKDSATRHEMDAYTAGVNHYISTLTQATLPLEYRLLNYYPEKWTNLKSALFLKYMSYDLTGAENDIEFTNAKSFFSEEDFNKLYPAFQDSLDPIVPKGTMYSAPAVHLFHLPMRTLHIFIGKAVLLTCKQLKQIKATAATTGLCRIKNKKRKADSVQRSASRVKSSVTLV